MKASVAWINQYLSPGDVTAAQAEQLLTFAGFPIDATEPVPAPPGDTRLEVELTSNRGDCLCHVGLAREIAAAGSGRAFRPPATPSLGGNTVNSLDGYTLNNGVSTAGCPRFTLRLIKGVKVAASPAWLKERLESIGQRSINNVVDATNFVLHELGQPSHVFDAATLKGKAISVRPAAKGEKLALLDGTTVILGGGELVICDQSGPVSLAGVMGGEPTSVTEKTSDVLLEVATWEPVAVRTASRRHGKRTDSSHRYERWVDARTMDAAAARLVELITQVAGGKLADGVLDAGAPAHPLTTITLRPARVEQVLGIKVSDDDIRRTLTAHGFVIQSGTGAWAVTVPPHRPDAALEIDLIEEVARTIGYDTLTVPEKISVAVSPPQKSEAARREMARILTGMGFFEAVTFIFTSNKFARPFAPLSGGELVRVSDDRRGEDNVCRPSTLCGLLDCRRHNQDQKSTAGAPLRLYETGTVFAQHDGVTLQRQTLALVMDAPTGGNAFERAQLGLRQMRAVVEQLVASLSRHPLSTVPVELPTIGAFDPTAAAAVVLNGKSIGRYALLTPATLSAFGLHNQVVVAELDLEPLLAAYPPRATVKELPVFPPTERDLSLIVDEAVHWAQIDAAITATPPALMEQMRFVTTYRGQPVPAGKKSVTLRMTFRAADRTLRDEEVNPSVDALVKTLGDKVGAAVRTA